MKITKSQLQRIIKEELRQILRKQQEFLKEAHQPYEEVYGTTKHSFVEPGPGREWDDEAGAYVRTEELPYEPPPVSFPGAKVSTERGPGLQWNDELGGYVPFKKSIPHDPGYRMTNPKSRAFYEADPQLLRDLEAGEAAGTMVSGGPTMSMPMDESLINELTEAVLAKLTKR